MFYLYLLLLKNNQIYTGAAKDLKRRIEEHNSGKVLSTRNRRPLKLIHYEAYTLKEDALRREKYLKTTYGKRDIKRQLSSLLKLLKVKTGSPRDEHGAPYVHHRAIPAGRTLRQAQCKL